MGITGEQAATVAQDLRYIAHHSRHFVPFNSEVLRHLAVDAERGGVTAYLLAPFSGDPIRHSPGRRVLCALAYHAQTGRSPELIPYFAVTNAAVYGEPRDVGVDEAAVAGPLFLRTLEEHAESLGPVVARPIQANTPSRACALFGVLLHMANMTDLPIRVYEPGASAGLVARAPSYGYRVGDRVLGDPASPLVLTPNFGAVKPGLLERQPVVAGVEASDVRPIDIGDPDARRMLRAWSCAHAADVAVLDSALLVAARHGMDIETADATEWIGRRVAPHQPGEARLLWHSFLRYYLDPARRDEFDRHIEAIGRESTPESPFVVAGVELSRQSVGQVTPVLSVTTFHGGHSRTVSYGVENETLTTVDFGEPKLDRVSPLAPRARPAHPFTQGWSTRPAGLSRGAWWERIGPSYGGPPRHLH